MRARLTLLPLIILAFFVFLLSATARPAGSVLPAWPGEADVVPGRLVVWLEAGGQLSPESLPETFEARVIGKSPALAIRMALRGTDVAGQTALRANVLRAAPGVAGVGLDYRVTAAGDPNDPKYADEWHLPAIRAGEAWNIETGDSDVIIAIVDTGADYGHPDLRDKLLPGYDFANGDANPSDDQGHGTHVAGTAAAATNNGIGVAAPCWACRLLPVKALDRNGAGGHTQIARAITYAVDQGARVINLSLGGPYTSATLQGAIDYAWGRGAVIVAAAGNAGNTKAVYPAAYGRVIAVAALDTNSRRATWSNYGPWIDLAAPGVSIWSTTRGGTYQAWAGTSMASPVVAGVAGLVFSAHSDWSNAQIRQAVEDSARPLDEAGLGHGAIDAYAALLAGDTAPPPVPEATITPTPRPSPTSEPNRSGQLVELINREREGQGLSPLARDPRLDEAARSHSADMATNNFCSHAGSNGSSPEQRMLAAGYPYPLYEVVGCGYGSAQTLFDAIMATGTNPARPTPRDRILATEAADVGAANVAARWTIDLGEAGIVRPPTPTPEPTPTLEATATPAPAQGCEIVVRDVEKRHIWHAIAEIEFLGADAYIQGSGPYSLGIIASPLAVCQAWRTIYEAAGYAVTP